MGIFCLRPYLRSPRTVPTIVRRLQRRDVDGAIRRSRASDRRPEGERDGSRSGRPGKPADGEAPAMAGNRRPPNGCMAGSDASATEQSGWPKSGPGQKPPLTRAPKGCPLGRATAPILGCRVGARVPVAPSRPRPAGPVAFAACERRTLGSRHMERAPAARYWSALNRLNPLSDVAVADGGVGAARPGAGSMTVGPNFCTSRMASARSVVPSASRR
jgi:hypothetical protein